MSVKSQELLRYFDDVRVEEPKTGKTAISLATQQPAAIRTSLLIAALHYTWKIGELQSFEQTYMTHKVECIRAVNEWLDDPVARTTIACVRSISTLCIVESWFGNSTAANAHLDGLMAILDSREDQRHNTPSGEDDYYDILERYCAVAHEFVHATTGRLHLRLTNALEEARRNRSRESSEKDENPHTMRLIPYFLDEPAPKSILTTPTSTTLDKDSLRMLTAMVGERYSYRLCNMVNSFLASARSPAEALQALNYVKSLAKPVLESDNLTPQSSQSQESSPQNLLDGLCTAVGLFTDIVEVDKPASECEAFVRSFIKLTKDIDHTEPGMIVPGVTPGMAIEGTSHDLWLWKVFTGAYALARTQLYAEELQGPQRGDNNPWTMLRTWFGQRIRRWSELTDTTDWQEAQEALSTVTWPDNFPGAGLAEQVWQEAVWGNMHTERFGLENILVPH